MELKFVGVSMWLIMCGAIKSKWLSVRGISFRNYTWYLSKFHGRCLTPYAGEPSVITNWQPTMSGRKGKITISLFCFCIRKHMYLGPYRPCWFWAMELKEMGISIYQSSTLLMKWYIKVDHANMVAVLLACSHIYIGSWQWGVTATSFFWGKQEGLPPTELY